MALIGAAPTGVMAAELGHDRARSVVCQSRSWRAWSGTTCMRSSTMDMGPPAMKRPP